MVSGLASTARKYRNMNTDWCFLSSQTFLSKMRKQGRSKGHRKGKKENGSKNEKP